jgi:hypothetical protein
MEARIASVGHAAGGGLEKYEGNPLRERCGKAQAKGI